MATDTTYDFQQQLIQVLGWIFLGVGALMVPFALYLAFKVATATDSNKRRDALKHVVNAVVSLIIIVILVTFLATWGGFSFTPGYRADERDPGGIGQPPESHPLPPLPDGNFNFISPVAFRSGSAHMPFNGTNTIRNLSSSEHNEHWPGFPNGRAVDIGNDGWTGDQRLIIVASARGRVTSIRSSQQDDYGKNLNTWRPGPGISTAGNMIVLQHQIGGVSFTTTYMHLAPPARNPFTQNLRTGDYVEQGTPIGTMGSTGSSTAVHLCFVLRRNGVSEPLRNHFNLHLRNTGGSFSNWNLSASPQENNDNHQFENSFLVYAIPSQVRRFNNPFGEQHKVA